MLFKCFFLLLVLTAILFSGEDSLWHFFYFLLLRPFCSAEQNHFSNFGRVSAKDYFCEIILKSTHWPWRRGRLKVFFYFYF